MPETATDMPIVLEEGIPWGFEFVAKDIDGIPVPLHGYTFKLDVLENISKKIPFISLSTENGAITVYPDEGKVLVFFSEQISKTKNTSGIYDFIGFSPTKVPFKILKGSLSIVQTVTQWS